MNFRYLADHLRSTGEAAARFFKTEQGISKFEVEAPIDKHLGYRPALGAMTRDYHHLCIEVSESPYPRSLDAVVLDIVNRALPVKLFVAFPGGTEPADYKQLVDRARTNGVGVVEIFPDRGEVIHQATPLSLMSVRRIEKGRFPLRYRAALSEAEAVFLSGSPSPGCQLIYQEIENLSRAIAEKTKALRLWRALRPGEKAPRLNLRRGPWAKVLETLQGHLDPQKCSCIERALLNRIAGVTPYRNETGHRARNRVERMKRDKEIRTRFESACDLLLDLVNASKPLRV